MRCQEDSWKRHMSRGTVALARSDYEEAETAFRAALDRAQSNFGKDDSRFRQTMSLLAQIYFKQGNFKKAEPLLKQAVTYEGNGHEADHVDRAIDLICLAQINKSRGRLKAAFGQFEEATNILSGGNGQHAEGAVDELQQLLAEVKQSEEGHDVETLFQDLLAVADHVRAKHTVARPKQKKSQEPEYFGIEDRDPLEAWQAYINDGYEALLGGDTESSIKGYLLIDKAVRLGYEKLQEDLSTIVEGLTALAIASARVRKFDQSEELFQHAIEIAEAKLGLKHPSVAAIKLNLACFYRGLDHFQPARTYFLEAAEVLENSHELDDGEFQEISWSFLMMMRRSQLHSLSRDLLRQAIELEEQDNLKRANQLYESALAVMRQVFEDDHPEIAEVLYFQSNVLRRLNKHDEAEAAHNQAEHIDQQNYSRATMWEEITRDLPPLTVNFQNGA